MTQEQISKLAFAIWLAFDKHSSYVGDYKFGGGKTTCLDGVWDLEVIAKELEPVILEMLR